MNLSFLLREFGLAAKRVQDEASQAKADGLWTKIGPRLSAKAASTIDNARYHARRSHLQSNGSRQDVEVVAANVGILDQAIAAAVRRAEVVESRRSVVKRPEIMQLVSSTTRAA